MMVTVNVMDVPTVMPLRGPSIVKLPDNRSETGIGGGEGTVSDAVRAAVGAAGS
jgi:hypothetical protein